MRRKRYVIRLHKAVRRQIDAVARSEGYLTPAYISKLLEKRMETATVPYILNDSEEIFQLKAGGVEKGDIPMADRQISVYLSDFAYNRIGDITRWLKENVNRKIGPAYVIRDILYGQLTDIKDR